MVNYNILHDRPLELLGQDRYDQSIEYAKIAEYDLSYVEDEDLWLKSLAFLLPAATGLHKNESCYYSYDEYTINILRIALRLHALPRHNKHPYIQSCHFLLVASLVNITEDYSFGNKWLNELKVLQTIPKGHYNDKILHYFYQLSHHTINYFFNQYVEYLPHINTLNQQISNTINDFMRRSNDAYQLIDLVALGLWAKLLLEIKKDSNIDSIICILKDISKLVENDVYLYPSWTWIRSAIVKNLQNAMPPQSQKIGANVTP